MTGRILDPVLSSRRACHAVTAICLLLVCSVVVAGVIVPAGLRWDFANFYDAGHKVLAGQIDDLYDSRSLIEGRPPLGRMTFLAPPLSSVLYAPLAGLPPRTAHLVFKIENTLALGLALWLLYRHARTFVELTVGAEAAFLALFSVAIVLWQPFWTTYRVGGQTTSTVVLLLVIGLLAHTTGRLTLAAAGISFAVLIKPAVAPAFVFLLIGAGRGYAWRAAVTAIAIGATSLLLFGWEIHAEFLRRVMTETGRSTTSLHNSALTTWIENLRLPSDPRHEIPVRPALLTTIISGVQILILVLFAHLTLSARRHPWPSEQARRHSTFLVAVTFGLLVSPTVWEHYIALLFPLVACLIAARDRLSGLGRWILAWILLLVPAQNVIVSDWLHRWISVGTHAGALGLGLAKSGPLLLTAMFLWSRRNDLFAIYEAPAWATTRESSGVTELQSPVAT